MFLLPVVITASVAFACPGDADGGEHLVLGVPRGCIPGFMGHAMLLADTTRWSLDLPPGAHPVVDWEPRFERGTGSFPADVVAMNAVNNDDFPDYAVSDTTDDGGVYLFYGHPCPP